MTVRSLTTEKKSFFGFSFLSCTSGTPTVTMVGAKMMEQVVHRQDILKRQMENTMFCFFLKQINKQ